MGNGLLGSDVSPTARLLRIPVLGTLEAVEYRSQCPVAGGFVLFYTADLAGELGHASGEPGPAPGGQYAPGEDAVNPFEVGVLAPTLEQVFEGSVEGFGCFEGEAQLDLYGLCGLVAGFVARQAQRIFSR